MDSRGVTSAYLKARRSDVAALLGKAFTVKVDAKATYHSAEQDFRRAYVRYHVARSKSLAEFQLATGVPRTTLLRWLDELEMPNLLAQMGLVQPRARSSGGAGIR